MASELNHEQQEEWRPIAGYEGLYEVSSLGNVRGIARRVLRGTCLHSVRACVRKFSRHPQGYLSVTLRKDGKSRRFLVHRLVCAAFHENPKNFRCVNHKNGRKQDNWPSNLEWCTHLHNIIHALNTGLRVPIFENRPKGEANHRSVLTDGIVIEMRRLHYQAGLRISEIASRFDQSWCTTKNAVRRLTWTHLR